jgi:hypothetical protein
LAEKLVQIAFKGTISYQTLLSEVFKRILKKGRKGMISILLTDTSRERQGNIYISHSKFICGADLRLPPYTTRTSISRKGYEALKVLCSMATAEYKVVTGPEKYFEDADVSLNVRISSIIALIPKLPDDLDVLTNEDKLLNRVFSSTDTIGALEPEAAKNAGIDLPMPATLNWTPLEEPPAKPASPSNRAGSAGVSPASDSNANAASLIEIPKAKVPLVTEVLKSKEPLLSEVLKSKEPLLTEVRKTTPLIGDISNTKPPVLTDGSNSKPLVFTDVSKPVVYEGSKAKAPLVTEILKSKAPANEVPTTAKPAPQAVNAAPAATSQPASAAKPAAAPKSAATPKPPATQKPAAAPEAPSTNDVWHAVKDIDICLPIEGDDGEKETKFISLQDRAREELGPEANEEPKRPRRGSGVLSFAAAPFVNTYSACAHVLANVPKPLLIALAIIIAIAASGKINFPKLKLPGFASSNPSLAAPNAVPRMPEHVVHHQHVGTPTHLAPSHYSGAAGMATPPPPVILPKPDYYILNKDAPVQHRRAYQTAP